MENEKRLVLAIALSVAVVFFYQSYMRRFQKPYHQQPASVQKETVVPMAQQEGSAGAETRRRKFIRQQQLYQREETTIVENRLYRAVLTNVGAGIKELFIFPQKMKGKELMLISKVVSGEPLILETEDSTAEQPVAEWRLVKNEGGVVVYETEDENLKITKRIVFHNSNYIIELQLNIQNKQDVSKKIQYKITGGNTALTGRQMDNMHAGADVQAAGKIYRRKPSDKRIQGGEIFNGLSSWASTRSRYFSFVLKPQQQAEAAFIESSDKKRARSGVILGPVLLEPQETITRSYMLYAGPSTADLTTIIGIPAKDLVGYWISSGVAKIIFKGLKFFYNIFGNYGIAIILVALMISGLLFPLTRKSLHSMKEMQKIQPEVEEVRKAHKDNPQKMNKEIMELYKKHKVNPVGGCLPMFLQFPIFVALYQTLMRSIELRGAHFLWIKDLSGPDAAFTISQKLPIIGNNINILPVLMAIAMAVQQKVSHPKGAEVPEQQKMMSNIFPIFLGIIFYNLPSGLVLYWLTNTLLMLLMQEVVLKTRQPA